jgi:prephenate dehydrogenase
MIKSIVVVGYGRFGELFCDMFASDYEIAVVEGDPARTGIAESKGLKVIPLDQVGGFSAVLFAVPINALESVLSDAAQFISSGQLVMDVCSVKSRPAQWMRDLMPKARIVATHPLFGPDSASHGLSGLKVAVCRVNTDTDEVSEMWRTKGLEVIETSPEAHDQDTAYSQGVTYIIARMVIRIAKRDIQFDTRSYRTLLQLADYSANDSEQLYHDMLHYNPYISEVLTVIKPISTKVLDQANRYTRQKQLDIET